MKYSGSTYYTDGVQGGSTPAVQEETVMAGYLLDAGNPQEGEQDSKSSPIPKLTEMKARRLEGCMII